MEQHKIDYDKGHVPKAAKKFKSKNILAVYGFPQEDRWKAKAILRNHVTGIFTLRPHVPDDMAMYLYFAKYEDMMTSKGKLDNQFVSSIKLSAYVVENPRQEEMPTPAKQIKIGPSAEFMDTSYYIQVEQKNHAARAEMINIDDMLVQSCDHLRNAINELKLRHSGLVCTVDRIVECEPSIGSTHKFVFLRQKTEGTGETSQSSVMKHHLPLRVVELLEALEQMVLPCEASLSYTTKVFVYINQSQHLMVALESYAPLKLFEKEVVNFFTRGPGRKCAIRSLNIFRPWFHRPLPVLGKSFITEYIAGFLLNLTPSTQMWSDFIGAEKLCKVVVSLLGARQDSVVLEIGCTNMIVGLYLSKYVQTLISVDRLIRKAKANSKQNGANITYFGGEPKDALQRALGFLEGESSVSSVLTLNQYDAPDVEFIQMLRRFQPLRRLVIVAEANTVAKVIRMLSDKGGSSDPLLPVRMVPVDTMPNTRRYVIAVLLLRVLDINASLSKSSGTSLYVQPVMQLASAGPQHKDVQDMLCAQEEERQRVLQQKQERCKRFEKQERSLQGEREQWRTFRLSDEQERLSVLQQEQEKWKTFEKQERSLQEDQEQWRAFQKEKRHRLSEEQERQQEQERCKTFEKQERSLQGEREQWRAFEEEKRHRLSEEQERQQEQERCKTFEKQERSLQGEREQWRAFEEEKRHRLSEEQERQQEQERSKTFEKQERSLQEEQERWRIIEEEIRRTLSEELQQEQERCKTFEERERSLQEEQERWRSFEEEERRRLSEEKERVLQQEQERCKTFEERERSLQEKQERWRTFEEEERRRLSEEKERLRVLQQEQERCKTFEKQERSLQVERKRWRTFEEEKRCRLSKEQERQRLLQQEQERRKTFEKQERSLREEQERCRTLEEKERWRGLESGKKWFAKEERHGLMEEHEDRSMMIRRFQDKYNNITKKNEQMKRQPEEKKEDHQNKETQVKVKKNRSGAQKRRCAKQRKMEAGTWTWENPAKKHLTSQEGTESTRGTKRSYSGSSSAYQHKKKPAPFTNTGLSKWL